MKKNFIYALSAVLIWSTTASLVKLLLSDIPNMEAMAISCILSTVFLFVVNIITGKIKLMKKYTLKDYAIMAGLGFIGLFIYTVLYYFGIDNLTAQEACVLNYLWPIMLVAFSCIILKEKLTVMKAVAMVCSFVGIVILSIGGGEIPSGNAALGIASCITCAACYGLFCVLNKKYDHDQGIAMMIMWGVTGVCSAILGHLTEEWVMISAVEFAGLAWLGIAINAIGYLIWALALQGTENTAKIANLAYLTPFLSIIVSAVFLKESLKLNALIALVFIIGGILLQNIQKNKEKK